MKLNKQIIMGFTENRFTCFESPALVSLLGQNWAWQAVVFNTKANLKLLCKLSCHWFFIFSGNIRFRLLCTEFTDGQMEVQYTNTLDWIVCFWGTDDKSHITAFGFAFYVSLWRNWKESVMRSDCRIIPSSVISSNTDMNTRLTAMNTLSDGLDESQTKVKCILEGKAPWMWASCHVLLPSRDWKHAILFSIFRLWTLDAKIFFWKSCCFCFTPSWCVWVLD